ncbi:MAG: hypothetical protein WBM54_01440 [Woeseia sp.]
MISTTRLKQPVDLLLLFKTFVDILALRKGPQHVPPSGVVLLIAIAMLLFSSYAAATLVGVREGHSYALAFLAYLLGIAFYAAIIFVSGHAARMMSAISSIIACGALITLSFVAAFVLLGPLLGPNVAGLIATLIIFWSVPVEGHIMAVTINQHWFVGIGIAMIAFVLQYGLQTAIGA